MNFGRIPSLVIMTALALALLSCAGAPASEAPAKPAPRAAATESAEPAPATSAPAAVRTTAPDATEKPAATSAPVATAPTNTTDPQSTAIAPPEPANTQAPVSTATTPPTAIPEAPAAPVGTNVGDRAPDFTLKLLSGTTSSAELLKERTSALPFLPLRPLTGLRRRVTAAKISGLQGHPGHRFLYSSLKPR